MLEKESDFRGDALVADIDRPPRVHRSGTGSALAADNHPIDAVKAELANRSNERLDR